MGVNTRCVLHKKTKMASFILYKNHFFRSAWHNIFIDYFYKIFSHKMERIRAFMSHFSKVNANKALRISSTFGPVDAGMLPFLAEEFTKKLVLK